MASTISHKDVTVISVLYNSAHCLDQLWVDVRPDQPFILVDNGSNDNSAVLAKQRFPYATVISNEKNFGFGAANNIALNKVTTPYSLLLNPDCELNNKILDELIATAQLHPDAAIIGPAQTKDIRKKQINLKESPYAVDFVTGAAMLINMENIREVGFFDEEFFLYYEDTDLCRRAKNANKKMIINPAVHLVHRSRGSVKGNHPLKAEYNRGFHHAQAKLIFCRKHRGYAKAKNLRKQVLIVALISLPFRCLIPVPRLVARLVGRIVGLTLYRFPAESL